MANSQLSKPQKKIGVGVIRNASGEILIDRRLSKGEMGGLWEFPGGKLEPEETVAECIKREIKEELNIQVEVGEHLITIEHQYPEFGVILFVCNCQYISGVPQTLESEEVRWVSANELDQYAFPEANYQIVALLQSR